MVLFDFQKSFINEGGLNEKTRYNFSNDIICYEWFKTG
ncbi:hypothetical protein ECDEC8A_5155 [Escherichia coli DEC8A]|nr:hypothetical protein ECDEC8A_5155 [Escherichia coli DEC8A]